MKRRLTALGALVLAVALCLTGCRGKSAAGSKITKSDAKKYVDGMIRQYYLGEYDPDYLELVNMTREDAEAAYEDSINTEVNFFIYNLYNIEFPDEKLTARLQRLYKEIYSHTKYTIASVDELEDGSFAVKVEVEPIDIVQQVDSSWDKDMEEFFKEYPSEVVNAMDDDEYEEFDGIWADKLLELYKAKMPEIGNMTAKSVVVQLKRNNSGLYVVDAESFRQLDDAIIDYTDSAGIMH